VSIPASFGSTEKQQSSARDLLNSVDNCADLRAESERYGETAYEDHIVTRAEIPGQYATTLAGLDRNEASVTFAGGSAEVLMVCNRVRDLPDEDREGLRNALVNQRITGFGNGYLQELKGNAFIQEQ
jgi:peptidyl-prolyl cis-trans isomerase SurA